MCVYLCLGVNILASMCSKVILALGKDSNLDLLAESTEALDISIPRPLQPVNLAISLSENPVVQAISKILESEFILE